jgi:hypothetical protein
MARFGFVGPTYQAQSLNANAQRCVNLYPEHDESGSGKSEWQMYNRPGLALFAILPGTNRSNGLWEANGRFFAVAGAALYEIFADGTFAALGAVVNDGNPVQMANSETQLLILSGGFMYGYQLNTNAFLGQVGSDWNGRADRLFGWISLRADQELADDLCLEPARYHHLAVDEFHHCFRFPRQHRFDVGKPERTLGPRSYEIGGLRRRGAVPFPFVPNLSRYMEEGTGAQWAEVALDNTLFWLNQNKRGSMVAYRLNGYNPVRVSNHAIENQWQSYTVTSDALGWSYEDRGHKFWVIYFPTQNVSWVYDVATGMWCEWSWLNPATGSRKVIWPSRIPSSSAGIWSATGATGTSTR